MRFIYRQPFLFAALCFSASFILLYPLYRYVFDFDGIGYMMITRRLANGDVLNAINGCWSPLQSWLLAPVCRLGVNEMTAFKVSNGVIGFGILFFVYRLLLKTTLSQPLRLAVLLTAIPVILSYGFFELAGDLLLCLLLLVYLDAVSDQRLFEKPLKNVWCGVIGALAYFSKAYALPFFIIHFSIVQFISWQQSDLINKNTLLFRNLLLSIGTLLLLAAPWVYALYVKYHFFTFSYAGTLNMSWELMPNNTPDVFTIAAPPAPGSPGYWEDPYFPPPYYNAFSSTRAFIKQLKVLFRNVTEALRCFHLISVLSICVLLALSAWLLKNKSRLFTVSWLTILILPCGYLLMHIEPRYIWVVTFLILVAGTVLLQQLLAWWQPKRSVKIVAWCIYFGSFLFYPASLLKEYANGDRSYTDLANILNQEQIHGKLACKWYESLPVQRVAYLTNNQCYLIKMADYTYDQLGEQLRKADIPYYFFYYSSLPELEMFRQTDFYKSSSPLHLPRFKLVIVKRR